ncbi:MAG: glycosyltransferase family 39 protein [Steroidobacteraceae bacterium]
MSKPSSLLALLSAVLLSIWCVGMLGRGYWTPDEPREADISWRMSWQADKAVPLLAGEPFCEKPPLTYWLAAMPIELLGVSAWAARLPNVLYAMITALAVGLLARRAAGSLAAFAAAAAIGSFLLSYQVAIWLATDAPLLAAVSLALLGLYHGFYAAGSRDRLRGYLLMHAALGVGFLAKSAAAWMVPALALTTLIVWERRWRELLRWELYVGLALQAAIVLLWVCFVYAGPDGSAHLKVFFWNNLVGRFASVDAPTELQYATGHRNSPGKYLLELPIYLWPWTLLCLAAVRRAWQRRRGPADQLRAVRFAVATFLPSLLILSVAATARDIYLAPALPGAALLLGWWSVEILRGHDCWDVRALRATTLLLLLAAVVEAAVVTLLGVAAGPSLEAPASYALIAALGIGVAVYLILYAWFALGRRRFLAAELALFVGYCSLLVGPASQAYHEADRWQDLAALGAALRADLDSDSLVLLAPDETTRAWVDMYTRTVVIRIPGPNDAAAIERLKAIMAATPHALALIQLEGRHLTPGMLALGKRFAITPRLTREERDPEWLAASGFAVAKRYALPNGRRYALLGPATARVALEPAIR